MKILWTVSNEPNLLLFWCPGCTRMHPVWVGPPRNGSGYPVWTWNRSMEKPTFTPSLLVYESKYDPRCHSFITDGRIQFLDDCTHALKGQTVDIPDSEAVLGA